MVILLVGLVCGIPFAVFANMLTPKFQYVWSRRSERAREKNSKMAAERRAIVEWFAENPQAFSGYALASILRAGRLMLLAASSGALSALALYMFIAEKNDWFMAVLGVGFVLFFASFEGVLRSLRRPMEIFYRLISLKGWPVDAYMKTFTRQEADPAPTSQNVEPAPEGDRAT